MGRKIRQAREEDLHRVCSLIEAVGEKEFRECGRRKVKAWKQHLHENVRRILSGPGSIMLVMEENGSVVACASGEVRGEEIVLANAYCSDPGNGRGREVLRQLLAWAVHFPNKTLRCDVFPGSDLDGFLHEIGFCDCASGQERDLDLPTRTLQSSPEGAFIALTQRL